MQQDDSSRQWLGGSGDTAAAEAGAAAAAEDEEDDDGLPPTREIARLIARMACNNHTICDEVCPQTWTALEQDGPDHLGLWVQCAYMSIKSGPNHLGSCAPAGPQSDRGRDVPACR